MSRWITGVFYSVEYTLNLAGEVVYIDPSDSFTGNTSILRDRAGRLQTVTDGSGSRTLVHGADGELQSETFNSGPLNGITLTRGQDAIGRLSGFTLQKGANILLTQGYGYDTATGRLSSATQGSVSSSMSYTPNADLVFQTMIRQNNDVKVTHTRNYDAAGRLSTMNSALGSGGEVSSGAYGFADAGNRNAVTSADGSVWRYAYNLRGELQSAQREWSDAVTVSGQQFSRSYDAMGNTLTTTTNGRAAKYLPNALNQYTQREVPGFADIIGNVSTQAKVITNQVRATRHGLYFHSAVPLDNSTAAVWQDIRTSAAHAGAGPSGADLLAEQTGKKFLPKTPELFVYDLDGNLTQDGRWDYTWNAENRLVALQTRTDLPADIPRIKIEYLYDYLGRRVSKRVSRNHNGFFWADQKQTLSTAVAGIQSLNSMRME
jgi:YD repeat-containing protein